MFLIYSQFSNYSLNPKSQPNFSLYPRSSQCPARFSLLYLAVSFCRDSLPHGSSARIVFLIDDGGENGSGCCYDGAGGSV